jgi:hypothetical protein
MGESEQNIEKNTETLLVASKEIIADIILYVNKSVVVFVLQNSGRIKYLKTGGKLFWNVGRVLMLGNNKHISISIHEKL